MSNYQRIVDAGVITPDPKNPFSSEDMNLIEGLSSTEVDHMISSCAHLGSNFLQRQRCMIAF